MLEAACVFCLIHNLYFPSTLSFSGSRSEGFGLPTVAPVSLYPAVSERDLKFSAGCQLEPLLCVRSERY